jgi:hypothetical protein
MTTQYFGSCHCGAAGFRYRTALPPAKWQVRACQCSFCRAHSALTTSDPRGSVEFILKEPVALNRYRFGLRTADFLVCRNCGVYVGASISTGSGRFAIINLRALRDAPIDLADAQPVSYEAESVGDRMARREARWTPVTGAV